MVDVQLLSHVQLFVTPWTIVYPPGPLAMVFSRPEYWIELPFPSPRELASPGIKPASSSLAGGFFTAEPPGEPPGILVFNENLWVSLKVESADGKWREVGM